MSPLLVAAVLTADLVVVNARVWTVNPNCGTVSSLASFLEQQIGQFLPAPELKVRLDFPESIPRRALAAEARHQLALSVREALTNVVRHAAATEVVIRLALEEQTLLLEVKDNGCGFQIGGPKGHGLENLAARLKQVGGSFEYASAPGAGTVLTFRLPVQGPPAGAKETR